MHRGVFTASSDLLDRHSQVRISECATFLQSPSYICLQMRVHEFLCSIYWSDLRYDSCCMTFSVSRWWSWSWQPAVRCWVFSSTRELTRRLSRRWTATSFLSTRRLPACPLEYSLPACLIVIVVWCRLIWLSVTVVIFIMNFGLVVDYSAHIAHHFMTHRGTPRERAAKALAEMGSSVFNGAFTTALGMLPLIWAPFETGEAAYFLLLVAVYGFEIAVCRSP